MVDSHDRANRRAALANVLAGVNDRYVIHAEIGRGGMGRVFEASDVKLGRRVAIKVLPPGAHTTDQLRRFEQEARAAGSLDHPNVLVVHDIGVADGAPYIVSERLEGATLRERMHALPLPTSTAVDYAIQLARGLNAAHEKGIVHRDLKPENLFITRDGRLKILDFGIAKLASEASGAARTTEEGGVIGTVAYMSPEQVRGHRADARSDIFAFGSILYEMLSGKHAFGGESPMEVGSAILHDEPPDLPARIPRGLDRVVRRCLEKNPQDRFQSLGEVALALAGEGRVTTGRAWRGAGIAAALLAMAGIAIAVGHRVRSPNTDVDRGSIAVLPFVNLSGDSTNDYFSDGVTEELINALVNIQGLRVSSRRSVSAYKGKTGDVARVGRELKVATVLEGSVRRDVGNVRITAQLTDAVGGFHLWSKTYDRELKNVFTLEDELARAIVQALKPRLRPGELVRPATSSVEAHEFYLKGLHLRNEGTEESLKRAVALFEKATAMDPQYAAAYTGVADSSLTLYTQFDLPSDTLAKARTAASRALELDESSAEVHTSLCLIALSEYQWPKAKNECQRAVDLKPGHADAHLAYARLLSQMGDLDAALQEAQRQRQLDPVSPSYLGTVYLWSRDYRRAIDVYRAELEMNPFYAPLHWTLGIALLLDGKTAEAIAELENSIALGDKTTRWRLGCAYAMAGRRADAEQILKELERTQSRSHGLRARLLAALGRKDEALLWLDKALTDRVWINIRDPLFDPLRSDARFTRVLHRMNLEN